MGQKNDYSPAWVSDDFSETRESQHIRFTTTTAFECKMGMQTMNELENYSTVAGSPPSEAASWTL